MPSLRAQVADDWPVPLWLQVQGNLSRLRTCRIPGAQEGEEMRQASVVAKLIGFGFLLGSLATRLDERAFFVGVGLMLIGVMLEGNRVRR